MSSMLYMRSVPADDRTARAIIRDEALRLFAARGPDGVTVRQIAVAAGVSPGLVLHHFGSKEGLRQAVDEHVLGLFDQMLGEMTGEHAADLYDPAASGSVAEAVVRHLPADSPLPEYLRRLLLADGGAGRELFRRLFRLSAATLDVLAAAGMAAPGRIRRSGRRSCWSTIWLCCCFGTTWPRFLAPIRCRARAWRAGPAKCSRSTVPGCWRHRPPRLPDGRAGPTERSAMKSLEAATVEVAR